MRDRITRYSGKVPETQTREVEVGIVPPPTTYMGLGERPAEVPDRGWHHPRYVSMWTDDDERMGILVERLAGPGYVDMGYVQRQAPTALGYALRHVVHGRLMGYPWLAVLAFTWRNRRWYRADPRRPTGR